MTLDRLLVCYLNISLIVIIRMLLLSAQSQLAAVADVNTKFFSSCL